MVRCRKADGRLAVLKVSPDRRRVQDEAVALARWRTAHVPAVLAVEESVRALLIEAIEPGLAVRRSVCDGPAETGPLDPDHGRGDGPTLAVRSMEEGGRV